jgi:hypothetical protein
MQGISTKRNCYDFNAMCYPEESTVTKGRHVNLDSYTMLSVSPSKTPIIFSRSSCSTSRRLQGMWFTVSGRLQQICRNINNSVQYTEKSARIMGHRVVPYSYKKMSTGFTETSLILPCRHDMTPRIF